MNESRIYFLNYKGNLKRLTAFSGAILVYPFLRHICNERADTVRQMAFGFVTVNLAIRAKLNKSWFTNIQQQTNHVGYEGGKVV